jgi:hypothetical protein
MTHADTPLRAGAIWRVGTDVAQPLGPCPRLLLLSHPQELPCGLTAVSAVPLCEELLIPQLLSDSDLLLLPPLVAEEVEHGLVLQFSALQSVLVGQLGEPDGELAPEALPLVKAFWKGVFGLAPRPMADQFPQIHPWCWESGRPIPDDRDQRLLRLVQARLLLRPLAEAHDRALQSEAYAALAPATEADPGCPQSILVKLAEHLDCDWERLTMAAGGGSAPDFGQVAAAALAGSASGAPLTAYEHRIALGGSDSPWDRAAHAVLSQDTALIKGALAQLPGRA